MHTLHWRHNDHGGVSNHQPHDCLLNRLFRRRSKKTSKLRVTGLCGTGEFPAQRVCNAESVSIWWRHHAYEDVCARRIYQGQAQLHPIVAEGCNCLSLPFVPASDTQVLVRRCVWLWYDGEKYAIYWIYISNPGSIKDPTSYHHRLGWWSVS